MEFDEVIEKRRSVRDFKSKRADWRAVLEAIDSARKNPWASNKDNLMFIIIENPETIQKIAKLSDQDWISDTGILVAVCSNDEILKGLFDEKGEIYAHQQAGAAIMTFLLKIVDQGLSACWVGSFDEEKLKEVLKCPKKIKIEAIIPVGYEQGKTSKQRKRSLENFIYWENWDKDKRPTLFKEPGIHDNF